MEPHPWLAASRSILFSAMSSVNPINRRLAAEALSQLCVVTDVEFVNSVINEIQSVLSAHSDPLKVSTCVFCLCNIQRSVDCRNGEAMTDIVIHVLIAECASYEQPLRTWCLHSVAIALQLNDVICDPQIVRWLLMTVSHSILQDAGGLLYENRISVNLSLLHVIYAFLCGVDHTVLEMYKYDCVTLLNIIDFVGSGVFG